MVVTKPDTDNSHDNGETKPPQCLKFKIKDDLSMLPLLSKLDFKNCGVRGCCSLPPTVIY